MNWFYEENGKSLGPVSGSHLDELLRSGRIPKSTLVWREGFDGWKQAAEVEPQFTEVKGPPPVPAAMESAAGPAATRCSFCGKAVVEDDLIRVSDRAVCAVCKPVFLQQLREGVSFPGTPVYAAFWPRFGAKVIDVIVEQILGYVFMALAGLLVFGSVAVAFSKPPEIADRSYIAFSIVMFVLASALGAVLSAWMLQHWQATPGKLAVGLRVVRADGSRLGFWRGFARYFAEMVSALFCLIGYFMAAFDGEKRTLHDRICDTRVVTKS